MNVSGANDFVRANSQVGERNLFSQDTFKAVLPLDFLVLVVFGLFVLFWFGLL